MAINYFKVLKKHTENSLLVVTREKGLLAEGISNDPGFYFLEKKNTFDLKALWRFKNILKKNKIDIVHAHGTSWFFAVLCKISGSDFKLIWHDHYGNSEFLKERPVRALKALSGCFDGIICVNQALKEWSKNRLQFKKELVFLPNFVLEEETGAKNLRGNEEYKLITVANLRLQKDHLNLLKAFDQLNERFSVSLHLFGCDYRDAYSEMLKREFEKREQVYYYGEVASVIPYLKSADIGVLSSRSEGLPVALIEYGLAGIAVVSTEVGEVKNMMNDLAKLVPANNSIALSKAISVYLQNSEARKNDAQLLKKRIKELYSEASVLDEYLNFIPKF